MTTTRLAAFFMMFLTASLFAESGGKPKAGLLRITTVEGETLSTYYNPKEISVDRNAPWQSGPSGNGQDQPGLEFTEPEPMTLSTELQFDTFETKTNVYMEHIRSLELLARVDPKLKRPPLLDIDWGVGTPRMRGVVEQISVRYTMFLPDGTPCRATVNIRVREAGAASLARHCSANQACAAGYTCRDSDGDGEGYCSRE